VHQSTRNLNFCPNGAPPDNRLAPNYDHMTLLTFLDKEIVRWKEILSVDYREWLTISYDGGKQEDK
jgi:hypothetical protein